jgi:hypothetical protein
LYASSSVRQKEQVAVKGFLRTIYCRFKATQIVWLNDSVGNKSCANSSKDSLIGATNDVYLTQNSEGFCGIRMNANDVPLATIISRGKTSL